MARPSSEQWAEVKAAYEIKNISIRELAASFGLSDTAVRKKASAEGWIKGGSSHLVDANIKVINDIRQISSQCSQLSSQHLDVISDEVAFKIQSDSDLQAIQRKINGMVESIDSPVQALALMNATVKHREARLGKSPDTAIQINASGSVNMVKADMSPQDAARAYADMVAAR